MQPIIVFFGLLVTLAIGTLRRPAVAYAAVLCLYGLQQWGEDSSLFLALHHTIANWGVASLVAIGLFGLRRFQGQLAPGVSRAWALGIALYLYAFFSLAWSPDLKIALTQWAAQIPYILVIGVASPLLLRNNDDVKCVCDWT